MHQNMHQSIPAEFLPYSGGTPAQYLAPGAIGLIRTGDTTQYANIILESASREEPLRCSIGMAGTRRPPRAR